MQLRSAALCGFQLLFMMLAPRPACSCIQLGFNYSLSCKGKIGFSKITYFGEEFFYFLFLFPPKKLFLLGGERHDL